MRPTTYRDIHDEFYNPTGVARDDKRSVRKIGFKMGKQGIAVTPEFLSDRAWVYHGHLNAALHTIDQRADVVRRRANDPWRNLSLFIMALAGLVIFGLALTVDYRIVHDFWTVVYSNEFLEVPQSLQDNVAFKSLQVLFAVIAIHFLISHAGPVGRGLFMVAIGVMVVGMLIGLGFLSTKTTLPEGATLFGEEMTRGAAAAESNDEILEELGLRDTTAAAEREVTEDEAYAEEATGLFSFDIRRADIDTMETIVFFGTFGLIFLFVSSVGALCLHYSLRSLNALFGGVEPERREHAVAWHHPITQRGEWRAKTRKDLADQFSRIRHAQRLIGDAGYRSHLMNRFFAEFAAGYMDGLTERARGVRGFLGLVPGVGAGRDEIIALRDDMRLAVDGARSEWTADAIEGVLPAKELRTSLGYREDQGGFWGAVRRLTGRDERQGDVIETTAIEAQPAPRERLRVVPPTRNADYGAA